MEEVHDAEFHAFLAEIPDELDNKAILKVLRERIPYCHVRNLSTWVCHREVWVGKCILSYSTARKKKNAINKLMKGALVRIPTPLGDLVLGKFNRNHKVKQNGGAASAP